MAKRVQIVRHTLVDADVFTGREGEITIELDNDRLRIHDNVLAGGHVIVNEVDVDAKDAVVSAEVTTHAADTSTHGVGVVAGVTESQTLTNKTLTAPVVNSPVVNGAISGDAFLDDDAMTADAADKVVSQQSLVAYIAATSQGLDAMLTALAALGTAADKLLYTTGVDTVAELAFPANARTFISAANFAAMRTAIGLVIGTDIQAEIISARGDLIRGDSSGDPEALTIGTSGFVPTSDGTDVAYAEVPLPRSHLSGLTISNNSAQPLDDVDIAIGAARDDGNAANLILASALIKQIDATWAVGTNAGGLDGTESVSGTPDINTWYHVWLIRRSDTGIVDVLFSESATAPTMPASGAYDQKTRIGSVLTDASANIIAFFQTGDEFLWKVPVSGWVHVNPGVAAVSRAILTPTGIKVRAILTVSLDQADATSNVFGWISALDEQTNTVPSAAVHTFRTGTVASGDKGSASSRAVVLTNTTNQVRSRLSLSSAFTTFNCSVLGWYDRRGKDA